MAVFQKTKPHEDTTQKRNLTSKDLQFLAELQAEMNTQDSMCQADPRFWVIAGTEECMTSQENAERIDLFDNEACETVASGVDEVKAFIKNHADIENDDELFTTIEDMVEQLNEQADNRYRIIYIESKHKNYQNTMFLTHKDAEDHLRKYGYNYDKTAHAYAMTAHRSPSVEKLYELIQHIDWAKLQAELGTSQTKTTPESGNEIQLQQATKKNTLQHCSYCVKRIRLHERFAVCRKCGAKFCKDCVDIGALESHINKKHKDFEGILT